MSAHADETDLTDVVHWSPRQGPFAGSLVRAPQGWAASAAALGIIAVGAVAIGALAVGRARFGEVRIDRLQVGDLHIVRRRGRPF